MKQLTRIRASSANSIRPQDGSGRANRGGAVAIRLPYGLGSPVSGRQRVAQIGMRRLLKSVTG